MRRVGDQALFDHIREEVKLIRGRGGGREGRWKEARETRGIIESIKILREHTHPINGIVLQSIELVAKRFPPPPARASSV